MAKTEDSHSSKRRTFSIEERLQILGKLEAGERIIDLAGEYKGNYSFTNFNYMDANIMSQSDQEHHKAQKEKIANLKKSKYRHKYKLQVLQQNKPYVKSIQFLHQLTKKQKLMQ
ncbi:hypothetical protein RN001_012192 [Aquatica leii]|uniref:Uncharacterized protein n=1 Tax=Aquatica leii TaxID=1421715 RepID=A0AAN7NY69_9COLE|nr:hypothetical protein RN001_012192 [Aquatica leii]